MTLTELAASYVNSVGGSAGYLEQMTVCVKRLDWRPEDLHPDLIDRYLTESLRHLSPQTVANHRRMLGTLLRFAVSEGIVEGSILRPLRRVKRPPPAPRAWSHDEIRHLLACAATLKGGRKCPHATLLRAWILTAYSTGLRLCDLLEIRHDALRGNRLLVRQQKTGQPQVVYVDDNAMEAIRALPVCGPKIFGSLICRDKLLAQMRRLVKHSQTPGSTKFLRRSGATYAEIHGKDTSGHLGHRSPGMKAYYVDRLLMAQERGDGPTTVPLKLTECA